MHKVLVEDSMARAVKRKTKLSGIMDNSTMGLTVGQAEIQISPETANNLRKLMSNNRPLFQWEGGKDQGKALLNIDGETVVYQFRKQGKSHFLNVTGNPSKLISGSNSLPVILKDGEFKGNAIMNTFQYSNRIMFALLDHIPGFDFKWSGRDKKILMDGKFNISRLQYAWYSADLGKSRNEVLLFLRKCYNGQNASKNKAYNLSKDLGLNVNAWDNHDGNLTIGGMIGDKKDFSLTLYSKDEAPNAMGEDSNNRLMSLIRFDATFYFPFLESQGIRTVVDLEQKYEDICEADGYDIGFVRWLANYTYERLKIKYITTMDINRYREMVRAAETLAENGKLNEQRLIRHWLDHGEVFASIAERCEKLGVNPKKHAEYIANVRKQTGVDINISRSFHDAMLLNRIMSSMTEEERSEFLISTRGNRAVKVEELMDRDTMKVDELSNLLSVEGITRIRKLKPVILKLKNFWVYKKLREMS